MKLAVYAVLGLGVISHSAMSAGESTSSVLSDVGAATLDRAVSSLSGVQINGGQDSGAVTIKISSTISTSDESKPGTTAFVGQFWTGSITASTPLNKGSDSNSTNLATLDGLANATTVEFKITSLRASGMLNPAASPTYSDLADRVCARMTAMYLRANPKSDAPDCDTNSVEQNDAADKEEFASLFLSSDKFRWFWGLSSKIGYQDYKFSNPSSLVAEDARRTPWSTGGFVAFNPTNLSHSLFTITAQYQEAYKDTKTQTLCPGSTGSGGLLHCVSGPIGDPAKSTKELISLEYRQAVGSAFAFVITPSYDYKARVTGIDFPLYFIQGASKSLTGGLEFGWRSDTHKVTVGLFVGQAFGAL